MRPTLPNAPRAFAACLALLIAATTAMQAGADESAERAAQRAFEEGMALMKRGKHPQACRQLEKSQRLQAAMGTQYRLAECYEAVGKLASAWESYLEVAAAARAAHMKTREEHTRKRADALRARLPTIAINVAPAVADTPGLRVADNDETVPAAKWSGYPVDLGRHRLTARAPGKRPWSAVIEVVGEGQRLEVRLARLQDEPEAATVARDQGDRPATDERDARAADAGGGLGGVAIAGITVGAAGLAATAAGVGIGVAGKSRYDESAPYCDDNTCTEQGLDIRDEGRRLGTTGTVVFVAGAAGAVAGALMWLLAPEPAESERSRAHGTPPRVGLWARGPLAGAALYW